MRRTPAALTVALITVVGWLPAAAPLATAQPLECEYPAYGDINADGTPELVVGVPNANGGAGAVDIFYDRAKAPTRVTAASLGFTASAGEEFGSSALITDLDGDGCSELVVGAPGADAGAGRVYIAKGTPSGLSDTPTYAPISSPSAGARFGATLSETSTAKQQDVLMIGAPGYDHPVKDAGAVALVELNRSTGTHKAPIMVNQATPGVAGSAKAGDGFGSVLAGNIVGVPAKGVGAAKDAGAVVRLLLKSTSPKLEVTGQEWTQNSPGVSGTAEAGDRFGASLTGGGFVAVGVPGEDVGSAKDAGMVHLFRQTDIAGANAFKQDHAYTQNTAGVPGTAEQGDRFGAAVAFGDMESGESGYNLWIGAPGESIGATARAGSVTRLGLGGSRLPNTALYSGHGLPGTPERGDQLGATLGTVGDDYNMEEDGSTSLLIGVPGEDRGTARDSGWVIFSRYSFDASPRTKGLANKAVAGERYGQVFGS